MPASRRPRGASLIEALVALAVAGLGMLALMRVQSGLRGDADLARQRTEAARVAEEAIEAWRAQTTAGSTPGWVGFGDIVSAPGTAVTVDASNTVYTLTRSVTAHAALNFKLLRVTVDWTDRTGAPQQVVLDSAIARTDAGAFAPLAAAPGGTPTRRPRNRHVAIPLQAQDMGNGTSVFRPPQPGGGATAWVFGNASGMITGVCSIAGELATPAEIAACDGNTSAHLLSGYVRFAASGVAPDAAQAERPRGRPRRLDVQVNLTTPSMWPHPGPALCYDDAPEAADAALDGQAVAYYCLIPANDRRAWSGYSTVVPLTYPGDAGSAWSIATVAAPIATHRLCRYTKAASDGEEIANWQHPRHYRIEFADAALRQVPLPTPPLTNQNFLVVEAGFACPRDGRADPAVGDFVDSNTLEHLPGP